MDGTLTFLGTGTSMGVPTVGCDCAVCSSTDPCDKRLRPSILLRWTCPAGTPRSVVIDTGPDFRQQAISSRIHRLDAVLYTHSHADHILGLDDLRPLSFAHFHESGPIPLYAMAETRSVLERIYSYTFSPSATYPNRAKVQLHPAEDGVPLHGVHFTPVPIFHGNMPIVGYRFGATAYLTDVSAIPDSSFPLLEGVETIVLSALRRHPHPSHATLDQAIAWTERIGARQAWFTHIAHDLPHQATNQQLPPHLQLAHDGLTVPVRLAG